MSRQAEELAAEFERAVADLERFVRECPDDDWEAWVPSEERPVRVVALHCAAGMRLVRDWLGPMRRGMAVPGEAGELDIYNAREMEENAAVTRAEVLEILSRDAPRTSALLRSLSDEELTIEAPFGPGGGIQLDLAQVAGAGQRHFAIHLGHIREALAGG